MIEAKAIEYKKAYVELGELLKRFPKEVFDKIPSNVLDNMESSKDKGYNWSYDETKSFDDQEIMVETKALFIQIYRKYLMAPEEQAKWEKYDQISKGYIEEEKAKQYDPSKVFEKKEERVSNTKTASFATVISTEEVEKDVDNKQYLILMEEESTFMKIKKMFKEFISKIFGKKK